MIPIVGNTLVLLQINFSLNSKVQEEPQSQCKYEMSSNNRGYNEGLHKYRG